ncbi:hypothetical protein BCV71DRAFT_281027 [Rhizopus microsporus]|uniref:Uncharacterized protein n=1 Tax=Rhizopus microsporus TaxID=58291 RepID=A0A1X0SFQ0_RHIZD|nr:hypothetical protein BCV71DRAFT_281027 [Rhizopus microsporus]
MNNDTVTALTTNCSSCRAPLPVDLAYRTCQTCRERVAATRRRRRTIPAAYISHLSRLRPLDLGRMDKECSHCHVLH